MLYFLVFRLSQFRNQIMSPEILLNNLNHYLPPIILIVFIILILFYLFLIFNFIFRNRMQNFKNNFFLYRFFRFSAFFKKQALLLAFLATLLATTLSLIYSEYLGVPPCGLCWLQRIFLYPQVILFAVAYIKNDFKIFIYSFYLSIIGAVIAFYHELLQLGYSELIPCPVVQNFIDCAKPAFLEYGFVTFPLASLTVFLFLIFLAKLVERNNEN